MINSYFPGEPKTPVVKTEIPGPASQEYIAKLNKVFDTRSLNMLADYSKSIGNYIVDPDAILYWTCKSSYNETVALYLPWGS